MTTEHQPPHTPRSNRARQFRIRTLMLAIAVLAVWMGTLGVREFGGLMLAVLGVLGAVLGIMLLAMALGWLGFGLFALADRLVAWSRKEPEWFQSIDEK